MIKLRFLMLIFMTTLVMIRCSISADKLVPYTSPHILPHQMVRLSFWKEEKDDDDKIMPKFDILDSTSDCCLIYGEPPKGKEIIYELDEDDKLRSCFTSEGYFSLSSNTQYAWISFGRPIKHEKAPLIIQTHDGIDFNTQALITGKTTIEVIPYCDSVVEKITISAIDPTKHIELKGSLSLVEPHQRESSSHIHLSGKKSPIIPWISPSTLEIPSPCAILDTNLKCTNGIFKISMKK